MSRRCYFIEGQMRISMSFDCSADPTRSLQESEGIIN